MTNVEVLRLPDMKTFKSRSKKISPYEKFYHWVIKELLGSVPKNIKINIMNIKINRQDADVLNEHENHWIRMIRKQSEAHYSWEHLEWSPYVEDTLERGRVKVYETGLVDDFEEYRRMKKQHQFNKKMRTLVSEK